MTWKGMVGQFTITGCIKGNYLETITHFIFWNEKKLLNKCSQGENLYNHLNILLIQVPTAGTGMQATSQAVWEAELVVIITFVIFQTKKYYTLVT